MWDFAHLTTPAAALLVCLGGATAISAPQPLAESLSRSKHWGYQLQNIDLDLLKQTACDVLVIDYSRDGSASTEFTPAEIGSLKERADRPRTVLAYLSVGEAEDYRFYWQADWASAPPHWLRLDAESWPGNYPVRYWELGWQRLIFGEPRAYLDRILSAGFDGVYLDRVDSFAEVDATLPEGERMRAMRNLVAELARYGRQRSPGFLVVPQNGEELLSDADYRNLIDGFAKEDLFFGIDHDETLNSAADVNASLALINILLAEGKPLFLAEYLSGRDAVADARKKAGPLGGRLFVGSRELDQVPSC